MLPMKNPINVEVSWLSTVPDAQDQFRKIWNAWIDDVSFKESKKAETSVAAAALPEFDE